MYKHEGDHAIRRDSLYGTTPEPTYAGVASFMRRKYVTDLEGVDVAVTGVPLDTATTNRPGSRFGPRSIRNASTIMAWEKPYGMAFDPFDKLAVGDTGDCFFDHGKPEKVPDAIEAHASRIIEQGPALLTLGGDHFITYPLLKAHAKKYGAPLSLLHFDAHSDTWEDENDRIDHGTMFFWATKYGIVDPATSMQIGLRSLDVDLTPFGARGCRLRNDLWWVMPTRLSEHPHVDDYLVGWQRVSLPPDKSLADAVLHAQWILVDREANWLGLVLSNGTRVRIGKPPSSLGVRWVESARLKAAHGNVLVGRAPVIKLRFTKT